VPTVLLNGDSGIAVGFATKLAPHNLREITAAISDPKKAKDLTPDFPTGCNIVADEELERYKQTGSGNIRCRALVSSAIQKRDGRAKDRPTLTFTNFPPGVNPEKLGEQIKTSLENGKIDGIAEIIDESDISGDRLTVIGKVDSRVDRLSQLLYHYTDLDTRYAARTLVIDGIKPIELNPHQVLAKWGEWRLAVLERAFRHDIDKKETRLEIVMGFLKAIEKIDIIIKLIRESQSKSEALIKLVDRPHKFTRDQATAILDMRLHQLTKLDANAMANEKVALWDAIENLKVLIKDKKERNLYMLKEIKSIGVRYGEKRRCEIIAPPEIITIEKGVTKREPAVSRPRFMKVDAKRGVAEQVKGPRGALVLDSKDKVILMTEDGHLKKVAASFKGMVSSSFTPIVLAKLEKYVSQRKFLAVFSFEGAIRAMVLNGVDLCKATSKGKTWLPENSTLLHFGESSYTVNWKSPRKNPLILDLQFKVGRPGGKGIKVANICDIAG
jgi:DNA gyrase subunit A